MSTAADGMTEQIAATATATDATTCTSPDRSRVENSGADLLLSLAERAAEHAASPSSSARSTPTTPPPACSSPNHVSRRAVSAERPSVSDTGKRPAAAAAAESESDHRVPPQPKRSRPSDEPVGHAVAEVAAAAAAVAEDEPKRIISPVDPKPEDADDEASEDEEKAAKEFESKAHGYGMFHGPPHCLFPPPNGRNGYPAMPYGPSFPFPHAFYPTPYPYGMVHAGPHHMMYPYMQHPSPPTARFPQQQQSSSSQSLSSSPSNAATSARPAAAPAKTAATTKPKISKSPTSTQTTKASSPKAAKSPAKKDEEEQEQQSKEEDDGRKTEPSEETVTNMNRCVPRKYLYPPADWRQRCMEVESVQVPDFHLLVNFPDYLARGRSNNNSMSHHERASGSKHCVMCGKARVSTTSTLGRGSTKRSDLLECQVEPATHIIPRQNKGVCTACDVAVWVIVNHPEELEIKWCKGCKNFRPWPAFGDKVLATKCVRCRERQKEKYAAQKGSNLKTEDDVFAADVLGNLSRATTHH